MKIMKIMTYAAVALTAFGIGIGLRELARWCADPSTAGAGVHSAVTRKLQPVAEKTATAPVVADRPGKEDLCDFVRSGHFDIAGKTPRGFRDFEDLEIDGVDDGNRYFSPHGVLQMKDKFPTIRLNIDGRDVSFWTDVVKGVNYYFEGRFVIEKIAAKTPEGEEYEETITLKGRLTKWRGVEKLAEADLKFTSDCGC